jgi:hypothetical protein
MTAEINRLWKLLRRAAPELFLALGDSHPEVNLGTLKTWDPSPFSPTSPIRASGRISRRPRYWRRWKDSAQRVGAGLSRGSTSRAHAFRPARHPQRCRSRPVPSGSACSKHTWLPSPRRSHDHPRQPCSRGTEANPWHRHRDRLDIGGGDHRHPPFRKRR